MLSDPISLILDAIDAAETMCGTVRANRNLSPVTLGLDDIESFLDESRRRILANIKTLHENYGDSLDKHNDSAVQRLLDSGKSLQKDLTQKLHNIAFRKNNQFAGRMENAHFDDLLEDLKIIDNDIYQSFRSINRRMGGDDLDLRSASKSSGFPRSSLKSDNKLGYGQVPVDSKLYQALVDVAENCWYEKVIQGRLVWVNIVDEDKIRMQRPENAFIKELDKDSNRPNPMQPFPQLGLFGRGFGGGGGMIPSMVRQKLQEEADRNNGNLWNGQGNAQGLQFRNLRGQHFHY